jgi:hypothetical protein
MTAFKDKGIQRYHNDACCIYRESGILACCLCCRLGITMEQCHRKHKGAVTATLLTAQDPQSRYNGIYSYDTDVERASSTWRKSLPPSLSDMRFMTATARSLRTSLASPS